MIIGYRLASWSGRLPDASRRDYERCRQSATSQVVCKNRPKASVFAYDLGVSSLDDFVDDRLAHGRAYFSREEAETGTRLESDAPTQPAGSTL